MYLDPFVAGVLTTIFGEMMVVIIFAVIQVWRKK